jgi:N-acetylglucosamine-6-phosphate deacetylase
MDGENRSLVIRNGSVLLGNGRLETCDLLLAQGHIVALGHGLAADAVLDVGGAFVLPGLIDLHTHGIGRESMASATLEDYCRLEAAHGATAFFPTLFGPPPESIGHMQRHRQHDPAHAGAQVAGFRLESPYLAQTGAGLSRDLAPITAETTEALLAAGGGQVKIWDISPELPGAPELVRRLSADGIVCSLAHTHASIEQARAVVDAGARLVTHLFDTFAVPAMVDPGVYPAGLVDYLLVEDRVACEIIADGTHVHPLLVEKALRCKTAERLAWVTDSNFGAGLPPGEYDAPGWGPIVVGHPNHGVRLRDRKLLAGSALTPIDGFRNAIRLFGRDLAVASRLCSATPARLLGLNKGTLDVGRDADIIVLDAGLGLLFTLVAGEIVNCRPGPCRSDRSD